MMRALPCILFITTVLTGAAPAMGQALVPRQPFPKAPVRAAPLPASATAAQRGLMQRRLVVKFMDGVVARSGPAGAVASRAGIDLGAANALATAAGARFRPALLVAESRLLDLKRRAETRSGRAAPDLAGILAVELPAATVADLESLGQRLQDLPTVEYAYIETLGTPPPGDIAPTTPDLEGNQGYLGGGAGMNVQFAWNNGLTGAGIRISDCEYGWNAAHEDVVDIDTHPEPGQTINPGVFTNGWDSHGTAVIGETSSVDNGYGTTGIAHGADLYTYTEWSVEQGFRRTTAVANAIIDSGPGDVVLLEMQAVGAGGDYGPAELDPTIFGMVRSGVLAGVVVVGAAGNGNQNLDSAAYESYMAKGDSGAILVGAGSANSSHNKLSFSTYGTRVDVQGWGQSVFTMGYGWFAAYGGDKNQRYTNGFSGTSSASPFVAGACALLQEHAIDTFGEPLEPTLLRHLLVSTGKPQGSGGHIGPLPHISAAMAALPGLEVDPWEDLGLGLAGVNGMPTLEVGGSLLPGTFLTLDIDNGPLLAFAWQVLGLTRVDAPFKQGTMVPSPDILLGPLLIASPTGSLSYWATFPGALSGAELYTQVWIQDGAAPAGWSATNAVKGTVP